MQKIAILSDIHGNIPALEAVAADIRARQIDEVFNLGDHASGPLWPKETIQFLMKQDWLQIRGNHDRLLVDQNPQQHGLSDGYAFQKLDQPELDWLKALPASLEVGQDFLLVHGSPTGDTTYLLETVEHGRARLATRDEILTRLGGTKPRILLCGHTHISRLVELSENTMLINPGSVGLPAYSDVVPEFHVMESGSPHARYAILELINGKWQMEQVAIPYDYHKAAQQAHRNNRPEWEIALLTGFMENRD